jgi:hypothetical protein
MSKDTLISAPLLLIISKTCIVTAMNLKPRHISKWKHKPIFSHSGRPKASSSVQRYQDFNEDIIATKIFVCSPYFTKSVFRHFVARDTQQQTD